MFYQLVQKTHSFGQKKKPVVNFSSLDKSSLELTQKELFVDGEVDIFDLLEQQKNNRKTAQ